MSVWRSSPTVPALYGAGGELVSVSIEVPAYDLESLLEALAEVRFPINPEIFHPHGAGPTIVEFPAYANGLDEVRHVLLAHGFSDNQIRIAGILEDPVSA